MKTLIFVLSLISFSLSQDERANPMKYALPL